MQDQCQFATDALTGAREIRSRCFVGAADDAKPSGDFAFQTLASRVPMGGLEPPFGLALAAASGWPSSWAGHGQRQAFRLASSQRGSVPGRLEVAPAAEVSPTATSGPVPARAKADSKSRADARPASVGPMPTSGRDQDRLKTLAIPKPDFYQFV